MSFEAKTRPIERLNVALSAGAVATSVLVGSPAFAASVALGAAIEALNFRGLAIGARALFEGTLGSGSGAWSALFAVRLGVLAPVLLLALRHGAEPVGLVVGLSMILPASVIGGWLVRPEIVPVELQPAAPAPDDPSWDAWNPWLARERRPSEDDDEGAEV
jgi:hypothetical protein